MNQEVYEKLKSADIAIEIEVRKQKWLGHVRINDERRGQKLLEDKPGGGKKINSQITADG